MVGNGGPPGSGLQVAIFIEFVDLYFVRVSKLVDLEKSLWLLTSGVVSIPAIDGADDTRSCGPVAFPALNQGLDTLDSKSGGVPDLDLLKIAALEQAVDHDEG
ncbi:hypothetical protein [Bordetella genomosp. 12]|uniref:hypothetical protein n=1 Tax=Bordetella genomosp. 12 TaxID=463035 RepID=UPI00117863B6|nr:hypothetical protein [Bordetella genomosp. 12]